MLIMTGHYGSLPCSSPPLENYREQTSSELLVHIRLFISDNRKYERQTDACVVVSVIEYKFIITV